MMERHPLIRTLALLMMLSWLSVLNAATPSEYNIEGKYQRIQPAQPLDAGDKVEVVDVFSYGCPFCNQFLPYLESWRTSKPESVNFKRLPVIFKDDWIPFARAYYAAKMLGQDADIHGPMFRAIHEQNVTIKSRDDIATLASQHGIEHRAFVDAYDSEQAIELTRQAEVYARRWQVLATPSIVINGKYLVSARTAGSYEDVIKVVDVLIERERSLMQSRKSQ